MTKESSPFDIGLGCYQQDTQCVITPQPQLDLDLTVLRIDGRACTTYEDSFDCSEGTQLPRDKQGRIVYKTGPERGSISLFRENRVEGPATSINLPPSRIAHGIYYSTPPPGTAEALVREANEKIKAGHPDQAHPLLKTAERMAWALPNEPLRVGDASRRRAVLDYIGVTWVSAGSAAEAKRIFLTLRGRQNYESWSIAEAIALKDVGAAQSLALVVSSNDPLRHLQGRILIIAAYTAVKKGNIEQGLALVRQVGANAPYVGITGSMDYYREIEKEVAKAGRMMTPKKPLEKMDEGEKRELYFAMAIKLCGNKRLEDILTGSSTQPPLTATLDEAELIVKNKISDPAAKAYFYGAIAVRRAQGGDKEGSLRLLKLMTDDPSRESHLAGIVIGVVDADMSALDQLTTAALESMGPRSTAEAFLSIANSRIEIKDYKIAKALIGQAWRAAGQITDKKTKDSFRGPIAVALAGVGEIEEAKIFLTGLAVGPDKNSHLAQAVMAIITHQPQAIQVAEVLAAEITEPKKKIWALYWDLTGYHLKAGNKKRAATLLRQARQAARLISNPEDRLSYSIGVAVKMAKAGLTNEVADLLREQRGQVESFDMMRAMGAMAENGHYNEALQLAKEWIKSTEKKAKAVIERVALPMAANGKTEQAVQLAIDALKYLRSPEIRVTREGAEAISYATLSVLKTLVEKGDLARAGQLIPFIRDEQKRGEAIALVANAHAKSHEFHLAQLRVATIADDKIRREATESLDDWVSSYIYNTLIPQGHYLRAVELRKFISDEAERIHIITAIIKSREERKASQASGV